MMSILLFTAPTGNVTATVTINGFGATFPAPFVSATAVAFGSAHSGYQINYQPVGSGAGITHLLNKDADFAASDAPLNDTQRLGAPNSLHIPETIGSVTLSYTIPNATKPSTYLPKGLNLTAAIIAEIYLGNITTWNDPAITGINPSWASVLPNHSITTVHRCDWSGTTFVWTSFLSMASPNSWGKNIGNGTTVNWSKGAHGSVCGFANSGVAAQIQTNSYFVGYVELYYAIANSLSYAQIRNPLGQFVEPTPASSQAAVSVGVGSLPRGDQSWFHVSLLNETATGAYPIVSLSYFLIYKEMNVITGETAQKANLVISYIWYHVHRNPGGQDLASALNYVPLPANVITIDENSLNLVTFGGAPVSHSLPSATPALPTALAIALLALFLGLEMVGLARRRP